MKPFQIIFCIILCAYNLIFGTAIAQVRLPQLVSDGMVLQRNSSIKLWGWASPNENFTIKFNGKSYRVTTPPNGKWNTILPAMKAGGPYTMQFNARNNITINNIMLGDVWFCAGQSNMVINMERVKEKYPTEIAEANYPQIRNFFVPTASDVRGIHDDLPPGKWMAATPQNVLSFGAVTYFFAKQIFQKYHVPVGIINSSVGGTPIQAWVSENRLKQIPTYATRLTQLKDTAYLNSVSKPIIGIKPGSKITDLGLTGTQKWFDTSYVADGWHNFWLPGYWADQGVRSLNGVIWFRKEVILPADMAGKPAKLFMGRIVDADETYVNGKLVGNTTYQYPPRRYEVPSNLLKAGKNIIVLRVTSTAGKGGFVYDKPYNLTSGSVDIDLRGDWKYQVGQVFPTTANSGNGITFSAQNEPAGLYNTMVAPAVNYNIKGILWYQGESNTGNPAEYNKLLPALIADWRTQWNQPDMPFIYAQLPNYMDVQYTPAQSQWAELREAQLNALQIPHTAMSVNIDAGEWNDIHPLNKKVVGQRMALAAEKVAYGDLNLVAMGPVYQSAQINGNQIIIQFTHTGSGLVAKNGNRLQQFAIAGADKKFVWANAEINGDKVIVYSSDVSNPLYVRYAWADNPEGANLYNREGLPASPFRTDK